MKMEENKNNETVASETEKEAKVGEVVGQEVFTEKDKEENKMMAILSYISFLVLIPYLFEKDSKWVKYHALQGLNLFIIELIIVVIGWVPLIGGIVSGVLGVLAFILSIIGILNVWNGEAKELPIVNKFKFIKK